MSTAHNHHEDVPKSPAQLVDDEKVTPAVEVPASEQLPDKEKVVPFVPEVAGSFLELIIRGSRS